MPEPAVLVLNCGSTSVKVALVEPGSGERYAFGQVDRIGVAGGPPGEWRFAASHALPVSEQRPSQGYDEAVRWLLEHAAGVAEPSAVGHRVVHGGPRFVEPALVDEVLLRELETLKTVAPLHNPPSIAGILTAHAVLPELPQVAVFDTAFHATLPPHALCYALPPEVTARHGIRRYGFHGLSHRHVAQTVAALRNDSEGRLVSLHLGAGCSACAIHGLRSLDTSMGMTPLEGLVMATRPGDLDPGVVLALAAAGEQAEQLLNRESGLRGLGGSADMRDIQQRMLAGDDRARLAFTLFCYRARKYIGAYAAALGGLDALAFTGGIGENSARVREEVCSGLEFLGVRLDPRANEHGTAVAREIGVPQAPVRVYVIPADEERLIAQDTLTTVRGVEAASAAGRAGEEPSCMSISPK